MKLLFVYKLSFFISDLKKKLFQFFLFSDQVKVRLGSTKETKEKKKLFYLFFGCYHNVHRMWVFSSLQSLGTRKGFLTSWTVLFLFLFLLFWTKRRKLNSLPRWKLFVVLGSEVVIVVVVIDRCEPLLLLLMWYSMLTAEVLLLLLLKRDQFVIISDRRSWEETWERIVVDVVVVKLFF